MTLLEKYKVIQEIGTEVEIPYGVWNLFRSHLYSLRISGNQICLGEDYTDMREARAAVEWYVKQLGGTVKWSKE